MSEGMSEAFSVYKRPTCDLCMRRKGDIREGTIVFCAKCYSAYTDQKKKTS